MKHSTKQDQRPSMQFYINDWIVDMRGYSLMARGLWIEMICMMFKNSKRGLLQQNNGSKHDSKSLAKVLGLPEEEIKKALRELEEGEVFSYIEDKTIYCRRMFREWNIGEIRRKAGKKGAKKRWQNYSKKDTKSIAKREEEVEEEKEEEEEDLLGGVKGGEKNIKFKFLNDDRFKNTFKDYLDMRKKIRRPATEKAEDLVLNKLHKYDINTAIKMLEQSIENSWQGVFPLKGNNRVEKKDPYQELLPEG